jgi:hypothetical protein
VLNDEELKFKLGDCFVEIEADEAETLLGE